MEQHRYWRIYITESTSGSTLLISLYEVEFRATLGGVDQCNGGSVFASHANSESYKLFDNNSSSYWVNGSPGEPTWFRYDFGAGQGVSVAEVRLLPRYASQSPKAFSLQFSDNDLDWSEAYHWQDISGWIGGVEKLFSPPPPPAIMVLDQESQPFSLLLGTEHGQGYVLGDWIRTVLIAPYAMSVERSQSHWASLLLTQQSTQRFERWLECQQAHPYGLWFSVQHSQSWKRFLSQGMVQTFHGQTDRGFSAAWSLRHRRVVAHCQHIVATCLVTKGHGQHYQHLLHNTVLGFRASFWNLSLSRAVLSPVAPLVIFNGVPVPLLSAVIDYKPEQMFWSAQLSLAQEADFGPLNLDDRFVLQVGEESFVFIVDAKRLNRSGTHAVDRILSGISPTAHHDFPRSAAVTSNWTMPVWARELVEELLSEAVVWDLPEWRIAANRLAVRDLSPLAVVRQIVASVGGTVQSQPGGGLWMRPRFPDTVPTWSQREPAHVLTDEADILEIREVRQTRLRVDRVIVRDGDLEGRARYFDLDWDRRADGPNRGRSPFAPGEEAHLLMTMGEDVTVASLSSSAGTLLSARPAMWQESEEVFFIASNRAKLSRPTTAIISVVWLGTDLGMPVVEEDGLTLVTPMIGTAIARITYTVSAATYPFIAPQTVAGETGFPVLFAATAETSNPQRMHVAGQRGNAIYPVLEVVAPLLSDYRALRARAQAELDQGEALQTLELSIVYRPGLLPGQLVAVQDGFYGRSFCALLVGVRHEIGVKGWVSQLTLLKN